MSIIERDRVELSGYGQQVTDYTLIDFLPEEASRWGEIRYLDLSHTAVRGPALRDLIYLPNLEGVFLDRIDELDGGVLKELVGLRHLQVLHLSDTPIDDDDLAPLAQSRSLRELVLMRTKVRGPGLTGFSQLTDLDLTDCGLEDGDLKHLAGLKELTSLELASNPISNTGLPVLVRLRKLRYLGLRATGVSFNTSLLTSFRRAGHGGKKIRDIQIYPVDFVRD